jgi:predicted sulfurtransferase
LLVARDAWPVGAASQATNNQPPATACLRAAGAQARVRHSHPFVKLRLPYWLRSSDAHCAACEAPHAHAVTAHCAACDREHCPMCFEVIDGEVLCSGCAKKKSKTKSKTTKTTKGRKTWQRARSGKAS